jgi:hypothetical protein
VNPPDLAPMVGGAALLVGGLVFLLPVRRKQVQQQEIFQENIDSLDHHLHEMRRQRGDLS